MALGQTLWSDNLDSYADGFVLNGVNLWTGWDGTNGTSGVVSNDQANSGANSVLIQGAATDAVVNWNASNYNTGAFNLTTMQYIPDTLSGSSYFILLNTFAVGGTATNNWSTQVQFNDAGEVVADFDGETLPQINNQWVQFRVAIDLDDDTHGVGFGRQIVSYGGSQLYDDTWTERVSGGGASAIEAIDLFANSASDVFYDDLVLAVQPQEGACCFVDGSCTDPTPRTTCLNTGGDYQGNGTLCSGSFCPVCTGSCDFATDTIVTFCSYPLPNTVQSHAIAGDTTGLPDLACPDEFPSGNEVHQIVIEEDGVYWFSLCNASSFQDNIVSLYADCTCASLITSNFDACTGGFSEIEATLTTGTYYVSVDGFGFTEGAYVLNVFQKCILECPPGSADENEPDCAVGGEVTNGGCNMAPGTEVFSSVQCTTGGYVVCGTTANDGGTRDTDWYAITVPSTKNLTWDVQGETAIVSGFIQTVDGKFGSADCEDGSGYISPATTRGACTTGTTSIVATTENDATYYLFVATPFGDVVDCGTLYIATLTCEDQASSEKICPSEADDFAVNGFIGGPVVGDALNCCADDGVYLQQTNSLPVSVIFPFAQIDVWGNTSFPGGNVVSIDYSITWRLTALVGGGQLPTAARTKIKRYQNGSPTVQVDVRAGLGFTDFTVTHTQSTAVVDYIKAADGEIGMQVQAFSPGNALNANWNVGIDELSITVNQ